MDALRFVDFSYAYPGAARAVLRGVDWSVPEGGFVLLVGATGSGKTTLLRAAKPELSVAGEKSGRVEVLGRVLEEGSGAGAADESRPGELAVGYVSQDPEVQVVCDTVWHELAFGLENLGTPPSLMRRRVAEVAHFFGMESWFGRETAKLSGGHKQLLNLASTLATRPRVLLLDEPTGQLDPVSAKRFLHALFRVNRECGITVVVATHAPESMAAYATEAARLRDGRVERISLEEAARGGLAFLEPEGGPSSEGAEPVGEPAPAEAVKAAAASAGDFALEVHEASFRYARDLPWVLSGVSVRVRRGSVHAIVGGNGCGKSTLLRLAAGAVKPERGRVRNRLADAQALVPQDPRALFACDSVREELMEWSAPAGYGEAEALRAARAFGLDGLLDVHPSDLSGGQQQLLAEAKALLTKPRLLLLDEPAKGLDATAKLKVARSLRRARDAGTTVLVVSHDLSFVEGVADEVTMLFDGEDACTEPTAAFFAGNLFFRPEPDAFSRLWAAERARPAAVEDGAQEQGR